MIFILIRLVDIAYQILLLMVIVKIILSYFMQPNQPIRQTLDNIVDPMLAPIRRIVPLIGMFDLSPIILIFLGRVLSSVIISFLGSLVF